MKRNQEKIRSAVIVLVLAFILTAFLSESALAATLRVPTAAYPTIQSVINAATTGDTVLVSDGIYKGGGNKNLLINKSITVQSENGPANCIIDCEGKGSNVPS